MLKKVFGALAAFAFAVSAACAASADQVLTVKSERGRGLFVYSGLVLRDSVHILGLNQLYSWKNGDAGLTDSALRGEGLGTDAVKEAVFSWDGEPWLLLSENGGGSAAPALKAVKLDLSAPDAAKAAETVNINTDGIIYSGSDISYGDFLGCGQTLYMIMNIDSGGNTLIRFDRGAGRSEIIRAGDVGLHFFPLKDGGFLLECADDAEREAWLERYDPVSGLFTAKGGRFKLPEGRGCLSCPAYDEDGDTLYFQEGQDILAAKGADAENAVRVAGVSDPETNFWNAGGILDGGRYVYFRQDAAVIVDLKANAKKTKRFTVADSTGSRAVADALEELGMLHADYETSVDAAERTDAAIADSVLKKNAEPDVYILYADSQVYKSLYDRGYLPEITVPDAVAAVNAMYPAVREVLTRDGRVLAFPVRAEGGTIGLNHTALKAIGENPDAVPDDWAGLLKKIGELGIKLGGSEQYSVFDPYATVPELRASLLDAILKTYEYDMLKNGAGGFDDSELAETLGELMKLDLPGMGVRQSIGKYETVPYRMPLVCEGVSTLCGTYVEDRVPHPLRVRKAGRPMLPLRLTVAVINPYTAHPEEAQEFISMLARHTDTVTAYTVSGEKNEPVADRQMQEKFEEMRAEADALRAGADDAMSAAAEDRAARLAELELNIATIEKLRWVISAEGLRRFRARPELLYVGRYPYTDSDAAKDLKRRYLEGELDTSRFLKSLDEKVSEMKREDA